MKDEPKYSPTWITDNFPLSELDCQFYDQCRMFDPKKCHYGSQCHGVIILEDNTSIKIRDILKRSLESFVQVENLHYQIVLILENEK